MRNTKKDSVKLCPRCKKAIAPYAAGITGQYHCDRCGYLGPLVLEVYKTPRHKRK